MELNLLLSIVAGIVLVFVLILYTKFPAFLALLIASIVTGVLAGMEPASIISTVQKGMGNTLGFVATVIGLGAMFGAILEKSGGAISIANSLLKISGEKYAPAALAFTGLIISIPVFFEVGFILLAPIIFSIQKKTGKSLLLYAIPLLAGLACGHAFIPPTPGPIAVANIVGAHVGWVILIGLLMGLPIVFIAGVVFGNYISKKIVIKEYPDFAEYLPSSKPLPKAPIVYAILSLPILLIFISAFSGEKEKGVTAFIGHPFTALIIANIVAWIFLGLKRGYTRQELFEVSSKSFAPVGAIILVIGAGGVLKEMLIDTGIGKMMAASLAGMGMNAIVFGYLTAAIVRILQGSATVAMITAAGLVTPLLSNHQYNNVELASIVTSIAAGATILAHVNDGGFWLIKQYLGMTEKQTFASWTVMTVILSVTGFFFSLFFFYVF